MQTPVTLSSSNALESEDGHPCRHCPLRGGGLCAVTVSGGLPVNGELPVSFSVHGPRQTVCKSGEPCPEVLVICSGWACRYHSLADGRRQITDFLLPGQMLLTGSPFRTHSNASVRTLTTVRTGRFDRAALANLLVQHPALLQQIGQRHVEETDRLEATVADVGRRSALTRIARLLHQVANRLIERGMVDGERFAFPVSHEQLADAVGLTTIHVGRMLKQLRANQVLELGRGQLLIRDRYRLREIAEETELG
jgi:CRP-like cAMP-binding protein